MSAGPVAPQALLKLLVHRVLILAGTHVDEVDHDQAAQVAQPQLAGDLLRRLQVGFPDGVVMVLATPGLARIHVD